MKNKNWLRTLLCLALVLCTVFTLCACPAADPGTPENPTPENPTPDNPTPPDGGDNGTEDGKPVPDAYADGSPVKGGGATLAADSFAMNATTYDESKAEEITANAFFRSAKRGEGKVFKITDGKAMTISRAAGQTYDGEGSILIAPNGVVIDNGRDLTLKNLTIIGTLTVTGCDDVTLEKVEVVTPETALTIDKETRLTKLNDCRLVGKNGIAVAGTSTVVLNSYISFTENGVQDTSVTTTTVRNCVLAGTTGVAIRSASSESAFRSNTITMAAAGTGIVIENGALNVLVALNDITGAQKSLVVGNVKNVSVILNRAVSVEATNNKNLYICDNNLGGRITANNNNYFLSDGNTFPADEWSHATVQSGNTNHNGNNLMDVDARLEVGADEALLPHIDRDLFVGMTRKDTVADHMDEEAVNIATYILAHSRTDDYVIIAPGAYATSTGLGFNADHNNTTIYGYGAYMERQNGLGQMMNYNRAENVVIKGLTIGFKQQSCGQVYVLEKLDRNPNGNTANIRVVTGAGMMNEFGNSNKSYFNTTGMGAQRMGTFYAYCDTGFWSIKSKDNKVEGVDTMIMEVALDVYAMLAEGDILTSRASNGGTTVSIGSECKGIVFYDFNIYGCAAGFAFTEYDARTATTYYRVCDTTRSGEIITEEMYNAYRALEEKYGVSLEVYKDEEGRFRGSPAHIGSIDATHTTRCGEGSKATFCIFENMCDDATNQNASHGRLDEWKQNADGTITLIYKGNLSEYSYSVNGVSNPVGLCHPFVVGDRVYVYTSKGQLVCDEPALSVTQQLDTVAFNWSDHGESGSTTIGKVTRYTVTIKGDTFNPDALQGYNLKNNSWRATHKVLVDNMSMSSNGFLFDNCKFQNIRSRGLLIKASNGTIKNCTFRNIGMSCAAILYEIYWGESGVTENMLVDRNLFDHTGYFKNQDLYATVSVFGLGSSVQEDFLLYKNITITNNHIMNRTTNYAIYINSAKDVVIKGNTFGPFVGNNFTNHKEDPDTPENPRPVIHINGAMNVEISDNIYPNMDLLGLDYVVAERNKNVFGSDVSIDATVNGPSMVPDDTSV